MFEDMPNVRSRGMSQPESVLGRHSLGSKSGRLSGDSIIFAPGMSRSVGVKCAASFLNAQKLDETSPLETGYSKDGVIRKIESDLALDEAGNLLQKLNGSDELLAVTAAISELFSGNMQLARANVLIHHLQSLTKRCRDAEQLFGNERARNTKLILELEDRDHVIFELQSEKQELAVNLSKRDAYATECRLEADRLMVELRERDRIIDEQRIEIERLNGEVSMANQSVSVCAAEFEDACAVSSALRNELNESANILAFYRNALAQRDADLDAVQRSFAEMMAEPSRNDASIGDSYHRAVTVDSVLSSSPNPVMEGSENRGSGLAASRMAELFPADVFSI